MIALTKKGVGLSDIYITECLVFEGCVIFWIKRHHE